MIEHAVDLARSVARDVLAPEAERTDREARWPARGMAALQQSGLGGLAVPSDCGGRGLGLLGLARVCEALGSACPSTALTFGMHCVGTAVIAARPTDDQRHRYLVPIGQGRHLTTLALSEPGTGAHFYLPETRLTAGPDGAWLVDGTKTFVTNGGHADSYVVSAASRAADEPATFSCLLLGADNPGLRWEGTWNGWGMRGNASITARLEGAPVPRADLLGHEGDQIWYVVHVVLPSFVVAMAGTYLGLSAAVLEHGRAHLLRRSYSHSGASLASVTVLQHRLGTLYGQVARTRALVLDAAARTDAGDADALPALLACKAEAAECAERVAADIMTVMGGVAYRDGSPVQRLYRDARAGHAMSRTTDLLRIWTGRALLGVPLFGD